MLQSHLFTKTRREAPKDEESRNAQLLLRAGFIQKEMTGVYAILPLGWRVMTKIADIVREEMTAIGGQEVALTALVSKELWDKTNRWDDREVDVWFKTKLKNGSDVGLATTNEETIANMMRDHVDSYRDLPRYVFQIQKKFRNELRARSGMLRAREFLMKDLYSFSASQADLDTFYKKCEVAYLKIFQRVGIGDDTFVTFASGGPFSKYSHEFQTICANGEDTIYLARAKRMAVNKEVYNEEVLSELKLEKSEMEEVRAIEVGNIFKLGKRFSEPLGLTFLDAAGKRQPVVMGSYGIGIGRVMATIVEKMADDHGMVWPKTIAPYHAHLLVLGATADEVKTTADDVAQKLEKLGVEILYDDRDVTAGEKFSDADLIGLPYRLVISAKTIAAKTIEIRERGTGKITTFKNTEIAKIAKLVKD